MNYFWIVGVGIVIRVCVSIRMELGFESWGRVRVDARIGLGLHELFVQPNPNPDLNPKYLEELASLFDDANPRLHGWKSQG